MAITKEEIKGTKILNEIKSSNIKKTEYDILSERNRNRTGLGLSYRREFNNFSDLWLALRRKR
jgi:hypothetical protein